MSATKDRIHQSTEIAAKVFELLDYGDSQVLSNADALSIAHLASELIHTEEDLQILQLMINNRLRCIDRAK